MDDSINPMNQGGPAPAGAAAPVAEVPTAPPAAAPAENTCTCAGCKDALTKLEEKVNAIAAKVGA